jgi:hypothetical protein
MAAAKTPSDITHLFSDPQHFTDTETSDPVLGLAEQIARLTYVAAHVPDHGTGLRDATEALARVLKAETDLRVARLEKELLVIQPAQRGGLTLLKKD